MLYLFRLALVIFAHYLDASGTTISLLALLPYYTFFYNGGVVSLIFTVLILGYFYSLLNTMGVALTIGVANLLFMQILSFIMYHAHRVALKNRNLLGELQRTNTELELMADEVAELSAVEERMRLSRDLHDSVGHHLTAISIQLEKAAAYQEISEADSREAIFNAKQSASEALSEVRKFINTLKDNQDTFSFNTKARELVESLSVDGIQFEMDISGDEKKYPQHTRRNLYHSLQELLTNIQKHADASQVNIQIKFGRKEASLQVRDNGVGFKPRTAQRKDGHYGLKHLHERTAQMDGTLLIDSQKDKGTVAEISVPRAKQ
jgi:signal transduction histidine kinase